jgi:hypothetical protein
MPLASEAPLINGFVNTPDGSLQAMQAPADSGGAAFGNNSSKEGAGSAAGFGLTGSGWVRGGTGLGITQAQLQHLGNVTAPARFYFQSPVPNAIFPFEHTAYASSDFLYRYDISNPSNTGLIFGGSSGPTDVVTSSGLPATGGLELMTGQPLTFPSNGATLNQFGLLQGNGQHYAAMEGLAISGGDRAHNDMIVPGAPVPVPEPATFLLVATAAAVLALARWRFRHRSAE